MSYTAYNESEISYSYAPSHFHLDSKGSSVSNRGTGQLGNGKCGNTNWSLNMKPSSLYLIFFIFFPTRNILVRGSDSSMKALLPHCSWNPPWANCWTSLANSPVPGAKRWIDRAIAWHYCHELLLLSVNTASRQLVMLVLYGRSHYVAS